MAVSSTSVKGFKFRQNVYGVDQPGSVDFIIANSQTLTIGDAVRINTAGYLIVCAAGDPVLGILTGLVDLNGVNVFSPRAQGTAGTTLTPDDTVTVSSTNQSDATRNVKAQVQLDPAGANLYYNDADGDFAATNMLQMFDTTSGGDQISQASASDTNGQFQLIKLDPDNDGDLSKALFRVSEGQLYTGLNEATTKIGA